MNQSKKDKLLKYFRENADMCLNEAIKNSKDYKKQSEVINKFIKKVKDDLSDEIYKIAVEKKWTRLDYLESILLINYVSNIVMLEYRNKVWNYEYMAFARRIGEIWEPFCKIPFYIPLREDLQIYEPPKFEQVKQDLNDNIVNFVENLNIQIEEKEQLFRYFGVVWGLVESGGIKLGLDLHFNLGDTFYNVDYKSGFSSNEKGNTNRLLLVGSIYHSLPGNYKTLIFVRQKEEDNNHYLQTLKNSQYWEVFCADDAYDKIKDFTGFDLKQWMNNNMDWKNDISYEFKTYLENNDLLKYLTW